MKAKQDVEQLLGKNEKKKKKPAAIGALESGSPTASIDRKPLPGIIGKAPLAAVGAPHLGIADTVKQQQRFSMDSSNSSLGTETASTKSKSVSKLMTAKSNSNGDGADFGPETHDVDDPEALPQAAAAINYSTISQKPVSKYVNCVTSVYDNILIVLRLYICLWQVGKQKRFRISTIQFFLRETCLRINKDCAAAAIHGP